MKINKFTILALIIASLFTSCLEEDESGYNYNSQAKKDDNRLQDYMNENNIEAQKTNSGIYYTIAQEGDGEVEKTDQYSEIILKGTLIDGTTFTETATEATSFVSNYYIIDGLYESLTLLKPGGKGTFYIPSTLAYQDNETELIPSNSILIFTIELIATYDQPAFDDKQINLYLKGDKEDDSDDIETIKDESTGIYYKITTEGDGASPTSDSKITLTYKGYFLNDNVFDQSTTAIQFSLDKLIPGWQNIFPKFKEGTSGTFWLPSAQAYGTNGAGTIPPNTVLIFDFTLVKVD